MHGNKAVGRVGSIEFEELVKFAIAIVIVGILIILVLSFGDKQSGLWEKLKEFVFP